jgi:hypothetical protein
MQGLGREMDSGGFADIREEGLERFWACLPVEITNPYEEPSGWFGRGLCRCFPFFLAFSSGPPGSVREDGIIGSGTRTS